METLLVNSVGKAKRVTRGGREYVVVPMTSVVPGVLPGSKGPLYYPPEEVARNVRQWDDTVIVVYHPSDPVTGEPLSVNDPRVPDDSKIGVVRNSHYVDRLRHYGWFDVQKTEAADRRLVAQGKPAILPRLLAGEPVELSTGLFTDNVQAPPDYRDHLGNPYSGLIARNYRRDHLAVLPDQVGACSVKAGCGVNNAHAGDSLWDALVTNAESCVLNADGVCANCGGPGSGVPGPCPMGGGGKKLPKQIDIKTAPAKKLNDYLEKLRSHSSQINDELIAAGRGHELPTETRTKTDELAMRANHVRQLVYDVHEEFRRRREYHGGEGPIKRTLNAATQTTTPEGTSVTKTELIQSLIANGAFKDADKPKLEAFDEATLNGLADKFKPAAPAVPVTNCEGPKSLTDMLKNATPQERATWETAQRITANEKRRLIDTLTANAADATAKAKAAARYDALDLDALSDLVAAQPPITNADDARAQYATPAPVYAGSVFPSKPPVVNRYDGTKAPLKPYQPEPESDSPVANWKKKQAV